MEKFRVALVTESGEHLAENFDTKDEIDDFILNNNAKKYRILDKIKNEVIESEKGVIK